MKTLILTLFILLFSTTAMAGRSNNTLITHIIIKPNWIEIYTENNGGCGTQANRWHLTQTHANYQAMYSALLASKSANKKVDIVGNGVCGSGEEISWAYVMQQ